MWWLVLVDDEFCGVGIEVDDFEFGWFCVVFEMWCGFGGSY